MILLSQWYEPKTESRIRELAEIRSCNESLRAFDRVVYVDGSERKWSYADFFRMAENEYQGEVVVVANTDIAFDDSIRLLHKECKPNRLVTLTRWEPPFACPRMLGHFAYGRFFSGTQDAWCFVGGELPEMQLEVPLGVVGCDQIVAGWAASRGCEVTNPSMSIVTRHAAGDHHPPGTPVSFGLYGYPEMTIAGVRHSGLVFCHQWPHPEGSKDIGVIKTCRP